MKNLAYLILLPIGLLFGCQNMNDQEQVIIIPEELINEKRGKSKNRFTEDEYSKTIRATPSLQSFDWTGTVNGTIKVHGQYKTATTGPNDLGDILVGQLTYDKVGTPVNLIGQLSEDGKMARLLEMEDDGNIIGVLSGEWQDGTIKNGTWFSPIKHNDFSLSLEANTQKTENFQESAPINISGEYEYQYGDEGATGSLHVKNYDGDQATIGLICVTSPPNYNIAEIEELIVPIENNTARVDFGATCQFTIRFFDTFAVVDYNKQRKDCHFEQKAHVDGIYKKVK